MYAFHEYGIPSPQIAATAVDERGLKHTAHVASWYNTGTSMHVVTRPDVAETFSYDGENPKDAQDFLDMFQRVMLTAYPHPLNSVAWEDYINYHDKEYK